MLPLTDKQRDIYNFVKNSIENNGQAPEQEDIAKFVGTSTNTVRYHLSALARKNYIILHKNYKRGIEIV